MQAATIIIRPATEQDLEAIVAILASDTIGGHGDTPDAPARADYLPAVRKLEQAPRETP